MLADDLLDGVAAIAAFLNKSERATYHMIYSGALPTAFKKGQRWYARKSELEAAFRSDATNG
ncbi:helix-turn-helix domain-containing protein [Sphingobium estronivorans]|uniref:helix-turn-helix domain-containing protein n=1 Tax=Sphingobium estronivorans TaxID=1577690 RepID=UPI0012396977|nr:helix-turn-helix domain-containing protein [Sphingobium estronivorans]